MKGSSITRAIAGPVAVIVLCFSTSSQGMAADAKSAQDLTGVWLVRSGQIGVFSRDKPALTPEGEKLYRERQAAEKAGKGQDPSRTCISLGYPRNMYTRFPVQIVQDKEHIVELFATSQRVRRIFIDGRPQNKAMIEDFGPLYNGYAVGKWNGKGWEVETVGLMPDTWIDSSGVPKSPEARITERLERKGKTLLVETTIEDPVMLARPWKTRKVYDLGTDAAIQEDHSCRNEIVKNVNWASQGR